MAIRTTYRSAGKQVPYNYYTKERMEDGDIKLVGWGTYDRYSVLAGQAMKCSLSFFKSENDLNTALADADIDHESVNWSNQWMEPVISLTHLSDDGDY